MERRIDEFCCKWTLRILPSVNALDIEDIKTVVENNPFLELIDIQTTDLDKGWNFSVIVSYLGETPEQWDIPITEDTVQAFISNGTYPLNEE